MHGLQLFFRRLKQKMDKYLGLFIDDDEANFRNIKRIFKTRGIELLPYEDLPEDINQIYINALNKNADFIVIDYDLGKQAVKYTGIDVLKAVREQDSEIYLIYLTNKAFVEEHLGDFDQAIYKKNLAKDIDKIVSRLGRALSRDLSIKNERELERRYELQKEYLDTQIELLKMQLEKRG